MKMASHIDPDNWKKQRNKRLTILFGCLAVLAFAGLSVFLLLRWILPAAAYRKAESAYSNGRLPEAIDLFASAGPYRNAVERASKLAFAAQKNNSFEDALRNSQAGDLVAFGLYERDDDPEDGAEPIVWRIILKEPDRVLLLSEYVLEEKAYHQAFQEITWEQCSLRAWANGSFLKTAFSEEERLLIIKTTLKNGNNPVSGAKGGNDTSDRIFLLSFDDLIAAARESNLDVFSLEATATESAATHGLDTDPQTGSCCWWLRTPGKEASYVMYSDMSGLVLHYTRPNYPGYGFRPALWVFLPKD